MKLDATHLRYLTPDDFRVLTAVEMGMKNHELVPVDLISAIAGLRYGGATKVIKTLLRFKLVAHDRRKYDGYKLTYSGYDYLSLQAFSKRGILAFVGRQIGVGKESDVFLVSDADGNELVLKLHRLGRISFRAIKNKRDYLEHRKNASWMYMARLAAVKEFAFMKALHEEGFPTPVPVDVNRHCIVMKRVKGVSLQNVAELKHPGRVYDQLMAIIVRLGRAGLIHCDFNEFNLMVDDDEVVTMIDFPQMVSTSHANAKMYFDRDVQCIVTYFDRKFGYTSDNIPTFAGLGEKVGALDVTLAASGFTDENEAELQDAMEQERQLRASGLGDDADDDDDDDEEFDAPDGDDVDDSETAAEAGGASETKTETAAAPAVATVAPAAAATAREDAKDSHGEHDDDKDDDDDEDDDGGDDDEDEEDEERGDIMAPSDPIPRFGDRRRGGARGPRQAQSQEPEDIQQRVHSALWRKEMHHKRSKVNRNQVKNREKQKLMRDVNHD